MDASILMKEAFQDATIMSAKSTMTPLELTTKIVMKILWITKTSILKSLYRDH